MKKIALTAMAAIALLACGTNTELEVEQEPITDTVVVEEPSKEIVVDDDAIATFLASFELMQVDNLKLTPDLCDETEGSAYKGTLLDPEQYVQFLQPDPENVADGMFGFFMNSEAFGSKKFIVNDTFTGLMVRVPTELYGQALYLWLFNHEAGQLVSATLLTVDEGDAGDSHSTYSLILSGNGSLTVLSDVSTSTPKSDEQLEEEGLEPYAGDWLDWEYWVEYHHLTANGLEEVARTESDTTGLMPR